MIEVKCPAAELQHPVLSPNEDDIECRIQGNLRPARKRPNSMQVKGTPVVCCAAYAECKVWQAHKRQMEASRTQAVREMQRNIRAKHVVSAGGDDRDRLSIN
jgi:hypothetical protein